MLVWALNRYICIDIYLLIVLFCFQFFCLLFLYLGTDIIGFWLLKNTGQFGSVWYLLGGNKFGPLPVTPNQKIEIFFFFLEHEHLGRPNIDNYYYHILLYT